VRAEVMGTTSLQIDDRALPEAFDRLFAGTWPRIYTYIWLMLRHREDAEDLAAETFERALRAWGRGRRPTADVIPWLLLTARRLVIDRQRRRRLIAWLPLSSVPEAAAEDDAMRTSESAIWFETLRSSLSSRQFEALILRYQFDLTDRQIGNVMGLSEPGVRTIAMRALTALRQHPEVLDQ
jgi:RNA polymerase sigma-70 factor (ECF subfamily)